MYRLVKVPVPIMVNGKQYHTYDYQYYDENGKRVYPFSSDDDDTDDDTDEPTPNEPDWESYERNQFRKWDLYNDG